MDSRWWIMDKMNLNWGCLIYSYMFVFCIGWCGVSNNIWFLIWFFLIKDSILNIFF